MSCVDSCCSITNSDKLYKESPIEKRNILYVQCIAFGLVNCLAMQVMPKLYLCTLAVGFLHEVAAQRDYIVLFGKTSDKWRSGQFLDDCGGGCAALIAVISGLGISKIQGFIIGAAFFASHISHQAYVLVPVTAFVAGQKLAHHI